MHFQSSGSRRFANSYTRWALALGPVVGGLQGKVVIPDPGVRSVLTFTSDGQCYRYLNDTLQLSCSYVVKKEKTIYSVDSLDVIIFQDSTELKKVIVQLTQDTLGLGDNMIDGYASTFIRVAN